MWCLVTDSDFSTDLPDLAWEAGVWCRLRPLLVDPGLSGVTFGGEPSKERG